MSSTAELRVHRSRAPAAPAVRPRPGSDARTRSHRGSTELAKGSHHEPSGGVGLLADSEAAACRAIPGGSPTGAPPPPRRCPHPQAGGPGRYTPTMTAPARSGRAVLLAPGILSRQDLAPLGGRAANRGRRLTRHRRAATIMACGSRGCRRNIRGPAPNAVASGKCPGGQGSGAAGWSACSWLRSR
jgi:hypothetical protein